MDRTELIEKIDDAIFNDKEKIEFHDVTQEDITFIRKLLENRDGCEYTWNTEQLDDFRYNATFKLKYVMEMSDWDYEDEIYENRDQCYLYLFYDYYLDKCEVPCAAIVNGTLMLDYDKYTEVDFKETYLCNSPCEPFHCCSLYYVKGKYLQKFKDLFQMKFPHCAPIRNVGFQFQS